MLFKARVAIELSNATENFRVCGIIERAHVLDCGTELVVVIERRLLNRRQKHPFFVRMEIPPTH